MVFTFSQSRYLLLFLILNYPESKKGIIERKEFGFEDSNGFDPVFR